MQKHLRTTYKLVYSFRSQTRRWKCEKLSERSSRLHNRKWSCGCKMSAMPSAQRREASESRRLLLLFNAVLFSCLQAPLISTYGTHIYIYTVYIGIEFFIKLHPNSFCVCLFCLLGILLPTTQADILLLRAEDKTTRLCLLAVTLLCMKVLRHAWWNYAKRWVTGLSFALNWILMRITWSNMVRYFLLPC